MEPLGFLPVGLVVGLSGSLLPGPMLAYTATKSLSDGPGVGPRVVAGHLLTEAFYLSLFALGLRTLFEQSSVEALLKAIGGILLLLLGLLGFRALRKRLETSSSHALSIHPMAAGVLLSSVLNPTVPLWWVSIGFSNLLVAYELARVAGIAFWLVGHSLSDILWFCSVSALCGRGRSLVGTGLHRSLIAICSAFLIGWGLFLLARL
jgi:threonine/homoserine/homoserine lactone efflux protein